jgi:hypothetical protein
LFFGIFEPTDLKNKVRVIRVIWKGGELYELYGREESYMEGGGLKGFEYKI